MTKRRLLQEWPLAAFTLMIQIACGIAIGTTIAQAQSSERTAAVRILGLSVFPIAAIGIALSLAHLGRPLSAWRALSNCFYSRLSLEALLTGAFAVSAFAYSFACWNGGAAFRVYAGATASLLGIAAVIAAASIYQVPTKRIWNSAWVLTSFVASTMIVAGLALSISAVPSRAGAIALFVGSALLLLSGVRMWELSHLLEYARGFHRWFAGYLLLVIATPLIFISLQESARGLFACCTFVVGLIVGRVLMFALGELEPRF